MATAKVDSIKSKKSKDVAASAAAASKSSKADSVKDDQTTAKESKSKPTAETMQVPGKVDIKQLLEAGAHFGHKTSRWHPKMAPFIHSKRAGNHVIDLTQTVSRLEQALEFLEQTASQGKQILLVGTKRQAHDITKELAISTGQPYVVERWLGGMLTNQNTIGGRVKYLKEQESKMESGALEAKYSKLEVQRFQEEIDEMNHIYGGIKNMVAKPGALVVFDVGHEINSVREARKLGVPIVALVDTNADPSAVEYPVPCNDDAIKTIKLVAGYVQAAIENGKAKHLKKANSTKPTDDGKTAEKSVI